MRQGFQPTTGSFFALTLAAALLGGRVAQAEEMAKPFMISADIKPRPLPETHDGKTQLTADSGAGVWGGEEVSAVPRRFQYALRLSTRAVYDDNIFLTRNNRQDGFYFAIEPGVTLGFGDITGSTQNYIRLDYGLSAFFYPDRSDADAIQHLLRLEGRYHLRRLVLSLSQEILFLDGANLGSPDAGPNPVPGVNLDAGGNTRFNTYNTRGTFAYDLTGKTFLSGVFLFTAHDYDNLIDSQNIQGNVFINYTYSPKLVVGLGGTGGYNWVAGSSPDQSYQQVNVRVTYVLSGKVNLDGSIGVEFRQFENNSRGAYISPVYELGGAYQPFDGTSISVRGSRRTQNSAVFAAQDYSSTNITFAVRQRFLRRIYLGVAFGFENSNYFSTVDGEEASRDDNYFFVQPSIDVTLTQSWTLGFYFLHRENETDAGPFGFYDNQFGLRTSFTF